MAQRVGNAALVVPGLWNALWKDKIHTFEHDPRLIPSVTNASAEELEQMRQQCLAAKLAQYRELGCRRHVRATRLAHRSCSGGGCWDGVRTSATARSPRTAREVRDGCIDRRP